MVTQRFVLPHYDLRPRRKLGAFCGQHCLCALLRVRNQVETRAMELLKVYGDTNTLRGNASNAVELVALKKLGVTIG